MKNRTIMVFLILSPLLGSGCAYRHLDSTGQYAQVWVAKECIENTNLDLSLLSRVPEEVELGTNLIARCTEFYSALLAGPTDANAKGLEQTFMSNYAYSNEYTGWRESKSKAEFRVLAPESDLREQCQVPCVAISSVYFQKDVVRLVIKYTTYGGSGTQYAVFKIHDWLFEKGQWRILPAEGLFDIPPRMYNPFLSPNSLPSI